MKTPSGVSPRAISTGGIAKNTMAIANPFFQGAIPATPAASKPAAPLQFLENRDLFFSSSSMRASIDPFLNNAKQKTLYLKFERAVNPLQRLMGQGANAVVVIEKGVLEKNGERLSVNTAHYTPDDTVLSTLFMPQLDTFYRLENSGKPSLLKTIFGWFGIQQNNETRIRMPQAQEGRVHKLEPEKIHTLKPGDKQGRTHIREDVLTAISMLEEQGFQLASQVTLDLPAVKNPFKDADLSEAIAPALLT